MFDKLKQVLMNLKDNLVGGIKSTAQKVINATPLANPTANNGNNFWSGPVAKGLAFTQDFFQNNKKISIPKTDLTFSFDKPVPEFEIKPENTLKTKVIKTAANLPAELVNGVTSFVTRTGQDVGQMTADNINRLKDKNATPELNYQTAKSGLTRLTMQAASKLDKTGNIQKNTGTKMGVKEILGNVSDPAEFALNILLWGKGKAAKEVVGKVIDVATKKGFKMAVIDGLKTGAKIGASYGTLEGLQNNRSEEDNLKYTLNMASQIAAGTVSGATVGGLAAAIPGAIGAAKKAVMKLKPEMSEKEAQKMATTYLRDELGRFTGQQTKIKDVKFVGDIREELGMSRYGDDIPQPGLSIRKLTKEEHLVNPANVSKNKGEQLPLDQKFFNPKASSEVVKDEDILVHGTSKKNAESIMKNGWNPDLSGGLSDTPEWMVLSKNQSAYGDTKLSTKLNNFKFIDEGDKRISKLLESGADVTKIQEKIRKLGFDGLKTGVVSGDEYYLLPEKVNTKLFQLNSDTGPKTAEQIINEVKMGKNQGTVPLTEKNPGLKQSKTTLPADQLGSDNVIPPLEVGKPKQTKSNKLLSSSDEILSQEKTRGFAETIMADKKIPKEVRDFAATQTYEPLTNPETLKTVSKIVKKGDAQAISFAKNDTGVNGNATAMVMLRKLIDKGRFDEVDDLIEAVSPRFTKQGQEIQILSQFSKLKPEGAVRYAQRLIDKANEANPRLKLKLTPENTKLITDRAKAIDGLTEGSREQIVAISQLMKEIHGVVPPSIGQKINTIQTMSQLLNFKTPVRNVLGNTIFGGMENLSDTVGNAVDFGTSFFTGKRTKVMPSLKAQGQGLIKGAKEGMEDVMLGIDTSGGVKSQYELPNQTFTKGFLSKAEKAMNITLRVPDRASYTAAYEGSLNNQMRAAGVNKATPEMIEVAKADGLYRTFQDNSKLAQVFGGVKKLLNKIGTPDGKFGLGDLILKYPKTPANILSRGMDYSPMGFVKGIYEATRPLITGKPFDQKTFVEDLSRAMVGTGVIATAYILAKKGIISGKSPKDYDVSATQQSSGGGNFKINTSALKRYITGGSTDQQAGDKLVSYDWAQPTSLLFSMGADLALNGDTKTSISDAIDTSTQTLTNQSLVKGLTNFAGDVKDKGVGTAVAKTAFGTPASFTPSILNQFASLFDTTGRSTYSPSKLEEAKNKVFARIPGLRNTLEPSVDVFGQNKKNYESSGVARVVDVMFNPAFVSTIRDNPAAQEVLDIYNRSGETQQAPRVAPKSIKIGGEDVQLTSEQYTQYQRLIGTKTQEVFDGLINSKTFQEADDTKKAKIMANALTDINAAAKKQLNLTKTTYKKSKDAPDGVIDTVGTYGKAVITDPGQTIQAVLKGNPIRKVEGGAVILERQNGLSALDNGDKATQVDHKIALTLGGTNDKSNLQVLSNAENKIKGQVETYLYNEMKAGRITKKEAQQRDLNWKDEISNLPKSTQEKLVEDLSSPEPTEKNKVYEIVNEDTGNITTIDLSKPIETPKLTGMDALDKKLKSSYSSAISTRITQVTKLYKDGQLSAKEANKMIEDLTAQKNKATGKGGVTAKKLKTFKKGVLEAKKKYYTAMGKYKLPTLDGTFFSSSKSSGKTVNTLKSRIKSASGIKLNKPTVPSIPVSQLFTRNTGGTNIAKAKQLVTGGGYAPTTSSMKLSKSFFRG